MATELTTPVPTETVTREAVAHWHVQVAYNTDGTPDLDNIYFEYHVGKYNAAGEPVDSVVERIAFNDWPAVFKADVKTVHNKVIIDAKNKGHIGAGIDSDDIP